MSSGVFTIAFGVKDYEVYAELKSLGITIDTDEDNLVDEGIFEGLYSGSGECPEWLGIEVETLDEYDTFIDIQELVTNTNCTRQTNHRRRFREAEQKLVKWLKDQGYKGAEDLDLPSPKYFIACGTD